MAGNGARYSTITVWFHWISTALIVAQIWLGFTFHDFPRGSAERTLYLDWHKLVGLVILFLALARLGHRLIVPPPAQPSALPAWERVVAKIGHWAIYVFMIALPLTGLMHISKFAEGGTLDIRGNIEFPVVPGGNLVADMGHFHALLAKLLIALLVVHVAAALYHQVRRSPAAGRMWPFR